MTLGVIKITFKRSGSDKINTKISDRINPRQSSPLELTISQHIVLQRGPIITVVECHDVSTEQLFLLSYTCTHRFLGIN